MAGGKLLMYHGFADPIVVSQDTINYLERIMSEQHLTLAQAQVFVRLFMVPFDGAARRHVYHGPAEEVGEGPAGRAARETGRSLTVSRRATASAARAVRPAGRGR